MSLEACADVEIDPFGNIYVALENPGRIVKLASLR